MILEHILTHGLFYSLVVTLYLFLMMVTLSPRVWGYSDYPPVVKDKVPPPTRGERRLALIIGLPWFFFGFAFPIYSTLLLESKLSGEIPFSAAFLNIFVMFLLATFGDLVILDWLVVSRITPKFVIIPGSEREDYRDFTHHYRGHAKAAPIMLIIAAVIGALISFL